ncbi:phosphatidylserine synthase [Pedobacter sp. AK013]|uniref:hypothetical protein n=1 Tax=Pedobacter sp. AK013 TaxID=2723071 RepID=UPI001609358A|nr:hypothetical protein [Pedobacter sp. AK013]MBB6236991.1 phosphatidylserine synthase [Pedobacter sp. AK013]
MNKKQHIRIKGIFRIVFSLLLVYSFCLIGIQWVKDSEFDKPVEEIAAHLTVFSFIVWFVATNMVNGLNEVRLKQIKYKTYMLSSVLFFVFIIVLIQKANQERWFAVIFGTIITIFLTYLTFADARYFYYKKKEQRAKGQ